MRCPAEPLEWGREAGWALQLCPKSERLPQRWEADSLQWLLIIQSQFVPSRRARSPAKPPLLAARSRQSLPGLLQRSIPRWQGAGSWDRLSCPIPERSRFPGTAASPSRRAPGLVTGIDPRGTGALCSLVDAIRAGSCSRCARGIGKQPLWSPHSRGIHAGEVGLKIFSSADPASCQLGFSTWGGWTKNLLFLLHPAIPSQDKVHPKAFLTPGFG